MNASSQKPIPGSSWSAVDLLLRLRNRHVFALDLILLLFTPALALALRVSLPWKPEFTYPLVIYTVLVLIIRLPVFAFFGLYSSYWRYASIAELLSILTAVAASGFVSLLAFFGMVGADFLFPIDLPRSLPIIDSLLAFWVVAGVRFSIRAAEYRRVTWNKKGGRRVLIAGAGDAGEKIAREMRSSNRLQYDLVAFVDDDPAKGNAIIHGVRVAGPLALIPSLVKSMHVEEVIIAMPAATGKVIREVVRLCDIAEVPSRSLPAIYELINGRASVSRIRSVEIADLLRREPVHVDITSVWRMLAGKRVLITGAGGSIGSELCTQIVACQPAQIIAVGHGENSLFHLVNHLEQVKLSLNGKGTAVITPVLADIRDQARMTTVYNAYKPQVVFHAAAHKHVPLTEANVDDAITTNVLGTRILVELSQAFDVERFVMISTDKAVNPVNILGMTKLLAEMIVRQAHESSQRPYVTVRFGNVLGSRGSVVPFFQQQIAAGGPVTVTHPAVTRFFMTIPESVQLVLQAATLGREREVFVLDMGEPLKIADLARDMIELSGYTVGRDIDIVYTGLRPGEKMYEELFAADERPGRTEHEKIFVASSEKTVPAHWLSGQVDELVCLAQGGDVDLARQKLAEIISRTPVYSTPIESDTGRFPALQRRY
jgi:FlaA1/EpsC-like NDP-sugar epimerase